MFPDVESLMLKGRPYYLPRKFTSLLVVAVYIPYAHSEHKLEECTTVFLCYIKGITTAFHCATPCRTMTN